MLNIEKLNTLATAVQGWPLDAAWASTDEEGVAHVGAKSEDDSPHLVVTVDTGNYDRPLDAMPLASFYAAVNPRAILELLTHVRDLEAKLDLQSKVIEGLSPPEAEVAAPAVAPSTFSAERKQLDREARFEAQHQFLLWNRGQPTQLVTRAYEYAVFTKAADLYQASLEKVLPSCPVATNDLLHAIWVLMGECESNADNNDDRFLKHQVEGFYRLYGTATGTELQPRWITRAAKKQAEAVTAELKKSLVDNAPAIFKVQMEKYLTEGATVTVGPQNEVPDVGNYAICVVDTDFWITCCDTEAAALALVAELGLTLEKGAHHEQ